METLTVKMNVSIAAENWSYSPGNVVELDLPLAEAWLESGHAVPVEGAKPNKTTLPEGVTYEGFGVFLVNKQRVAGKKQAAKLLKDLTDAGVIENELPASGDAADGGAAEPSGSESTPEG